MAGPVRRLLAVLAATAALSATTGCGATGVTADRVGAAVGTAFSRLYDEHQAALGRDTGRHASATATCRRFKQGVRDRGAGDDWQCILAFPSPDGHVEPVTYDVRVQPIGCYTAQGPSQVVGPQHQRTRDGRVVSNPLFEFDGCFAVT